MPGRNINNDKMNAWFNKMKGQSRRLTNQHKESKGVEGIFGDKAKLHDASVGDVSNEVLNKLVADFPYLQFRIRKSIDKKDINTALNQVNEDLGQTLYLANSSIKPDGGMIEVKDKNSDWRIILVSEAKHQGKDIENIKKGVLVGKNDDQVFMAAGNAIERSHKNISELKNLMLNEIHFPYVLFLEGSNFLTEDITVERPDGTKLEISHNNGTLNRIDRLTAANYSMPINTNHCVNKFVDNKNGQIMLQATSIYSHGKGDKWDANEMKGIMLEIANTSLSVLKDELPNESTKATLF